MKTKLKKFRIYAPPDVKSYGLNEDGTLTITGIASTTNKDLDGDIVTPEALKSLAEQVVGLNLHMDHNHHYDGGIGVVTDAELEEESLRITAKILPEYAKGIQERLDLGMNFGFSIGGLPITSSMNHNQINDFMLLEMSLTLLPANWDTYGTVESKGIVKSKCLTGACHYILKKSQVNETQNEVKENIMANEVEISDEIKQEFVDIVNEAIYNLKPQLLEDLRGDISTIVADAVAEFVQVEPEVKEVDEDEIESEDDVIIEEESEVDEVIDEEKDIPVDEEEVDIVETKSESDEVEEIPDESSDEPVVEAEEDEEIDEKDVTGVEEESEVEYVESSEAPKVIVDVKELAGEITKSIDLNSLTEEITKDVETRVFKKLNSQRKTKKITKKDSKLKQFEKETSKKSSDVKFLGGETRDHLGRNKKFL